MMYIVKIAMFFLFFVQPALAEERVLPDPFSKKLHTGNFCISEELLVELYRDKNGAVPGKKAGCGKLFIPMDYTVTPVRFLKLDSGDKIITRITNKLGDEAYVAFNLSQQTAQNSLEKMPELKN